MGQIYRSWFRTWGVALLSFFPGAPITAGSGQSLVEKVGPQNFKGGRVYGTVALIDKETISVKGLVEQPFAPKSYRGELELQLSAGLRAGRFDPAMTAGQSYLPGQVQIGDRVIIDFEQCRGASICTSIMIHKRPGGRIPPSPNVKQDEWNVERLGYKYHEYANAQQDWEERGIPLPDKYKPKPLPALPGAADAPSSPAVKPIPPAKP